MKTLAILGASGHGKMIADAALATGWEEVTFFDDAWPGVLENGHWHVLGDMEALTSSLDDYDGVVVGIGNGTVRRKKHRELCDAGAPLVNIIHPRAWISPYVKIGIGSVFFAGAVVNVDSAVGDACIVNSGATLGHDCILSHAVHVAPGAHLAGNVHVGERSWVGVGACVRQGIHIGSDVMVGAGAVVVTDIPDGVTVLGNPARVV